MIAISRGLSSKSDNRASLQVKKDEKTSLVEGQQVKEGLVKNDDFELNPFMNPLEVANLTEEEKQKYMALDDLRLDKKMWLTTKILSKESFLFFREQLFMWDELKEEKFVHDRDTDIIWTFKEKNDIKKWLITCDSMQNRGYSTCKLDVNKNGRLEFSGYLNCDKLPLDGQTFRTGFAHLSSPFKKTGFGLESYFNWNYFNHFVIRFKGDGRTYRILLKPQSLQGMQTESYYEYLLYTRGGPYWQVAKIPFSKFILCCGGRIQNKPSPLASMKIQSFAFTLVKYTGPYKLEISHIGVHRDERNYQDYDYEGYFVPGML